MSRLSDSNRTSVLIASKQYVGIVNTPFEVKTIDIDTNRVGNHILLRVPEFTVTPFVNEGNILTVTIPEFKSKPKLFECNRTRVIQGLTTTPATVFIQYDAAIDQTYMSIVIPDFTPGVAVTVKGFECVI